MAEILSPGVVVTEIDASSIVPTVSSSVGVFCGDFVKGPVGTSTLITSVADLLSFYGKPTNKTYNDFYQAYNFLQYGNKLLLARASNINGLFTDSTAAVGASVVAGASDVVTVGAGQGSTFAVGDVVSFVNTGTIAEYSVLSITGDALTLDRLLDANVTLADVVYKVERVANGVFEAVSGTTATAPAAYFGDLLTIENHADYEAKELSVAMSGVNAKLKLIARNPGAWSADLEIAIATPAAFGGTAEAFTGIALDDLFEYAPTGTEVGIVIRDAGIVVETWTVDFDMTARDHNNKSTYVENVINANSNYIFAKDNTANTATIADHIASATLGTIALVYGADSAIQADDLLNAYDLFANKEEVDVDIIIANELDGGASAKVVTDARLDCLGFIGANYADVVGKKSAIATANLIAWRKTGSLNVNSSFLVASGNYKYMYDRYNDVNRWVSLAGDTAGLRFLAQ